MCARIIDWLRSGRPIIACIASRATLLWRNFGKKSRTQIDIDEDDYFLTFSGRRSETRGFFEMFIMQDGLSHDNDVHLEIMCVFICSYIPMFQKNYEKGVYEY